MDFDMSRNAITTTVPNELTTARLSLFCLAISFLLFAATTRGMYDARPQPTAIIDLIVMTVLGGFLFFWNLLTLLACQTDLEAQNEPPRRIALCLSMEAAKRLHIPAGIVLGSHLVPPCPALGWPLGGAMAWVLPKLVIKLLQWRPTTTGPIALRGTRLISYDEAVRRAYAMVRPGRLLINWIGLPFPERLARHHLLLVGGTGSGKSVSIRLLLQTVLATITPGSDRRALIYDAKQDMLEILSGMRLQYDILILNPLDLRSFAWDIAKDVRSPVVALQVSSIFIQDDGHFTTDFFVKAARDLFASVLIALNLRRPCDWTLADVVMILSSTEQTRHLLDSVPATRATAREHFERDPETLANVQYTITANLAYLRVLAALWYHTSRKFSIEEWAKSESIIVLGNDESLRCPIDAINRVLFRRIVEVVLSQSESSSRRTWFVLDELKELGKLDALPRLLTKGRSKGVRAVLAFQTSEGLRDVYGDKLADEIAGIPASKAFFHSDSVATAAWASQVIGQAEYREWHKSTTEGKDATTTTTTEHRPTKDAVLPSEILRMPLADDERFTSYCVTPAIGVYRGETYFADQLWPKGTMPNFIPRPPEHQYLDADEEEDVAEEWTLDDIPRMKSRRHGQDHADGDNEE